MIDQSRASDAIH